VAVESGDNRGVFTVPAGASTGSHEAVERRDGDTRFGGDGVSTAIQTIYNNIEPIVTGRDVSDQEGIDATIVNHDGSENLSNFGANAVLGVSGAVLRTACSCAGEPLYRYIAEVKECQLPMPMVNIISGGLHARGGIEIQDFLVIPHGCQSFDRCLEAAWDVRQAVQDRIMTDGHRPLVADEGGFAPPLQNAEAAFEMLVDGITTAGYSPGGEISLAVDIASTHFYDPDSGMYNLQSTTEHLASREMADRVVRWTKKYPLASVEDPLAEDDWEGWKHLTARIDPDIQILGDDLIVTNKRRLERAIDTETANAVLVKPNQAGTITRTLDVVAHAHDESIAPVISARSGDTCDTTIADLAVGLRSGQIKVGSLARSERLAKYNRLLEIARFGDPAQPKFDDLSTK
jgi:enolase